MDKLNLKNITTFKTLNYHTSFIMCLLILNDGRLASSSDDGSIIIYDKETFNPQCEIKEFEYAVNNIIQLSYNNYLISSCADKTITIIKLTSLTTYNIISILDNHFLSVNRVIELDNFEIASCSDDQTVKIYKYNENYGSLFQCIITIASFPSIIEGITFIKKTKEIIISPFKEQIIQFWSLVFYNKICVLENIYFEGFQNSLLMLNNDILAIGVFSGINLIDVEKHEIINKIKVVGGVLNIIKQGNFLFTNGVFKGNYDTIQKWEIVNKKDINENNKNKNGKQNNINFNIIKKEVKHKLNNNHFILMNVLNNGIIATTTFQFNIKLWK